jgi:hypothetical protein
MLVVVSFVTCACFPSGVTATLGVIPNRNRRHDHVGGRIVRDVGVFPVSGDGDLNGAVATTMLVAVS